MSDLRSNLALIMLIFGVAVLMTFQFQVIKYIQALQQLAGPIIIKIKPGETKTFEWGLKTDKNESNNVALSADGNGANYLSFPKTVKLALSNLTDVQLKVSIPTNYIGNATLNPTIRATEAGEKGAPTILNIQMAKNLSIIVDQNKTVS